MAFPIVLWQSNSPFKAVAQNQNQPARLLQQVLENPETAQRYLLAQNYLNESTPVPLPTIPPTTKKSRYDGLDIPLETEESPIITMVDNYTVARPQHSGISSASIVYETLAEGGITRLMLVNPYQQQPKVGPIRSARSYFVDWAVEYHPVFLHAGGSPDALHWLWQYSNVLLNLDEDETPEDGSYTFRSPSFAAPHNLFANLIEAKAHAARRNFVSPPESRFCFNERISSPQTSTLLGIDFPAWGDSNYFVTFRYNPNTQTYERFYRRDAPVPHIDSLTGRQVAPSNIIVQITPYQARENDDKDRIDMITRGTEKAFYFSRGYTWEGSWSKVADHESTGIPKTLFLDENGNEICLSPGQTWIAILSNASLLDRNLEQNESQ